MVSQFDHSVSNVKSHRFPYFWERKLYCQKDYTLAVLSFHIFWKGKEILSVEGKNDCFSDFLPTIIWRKYYSPPPSLLFNFFLCISNTNGCRYGCFKNRHVDLYEVQKKLLSLIIDFYWVWNCISKTINDKLRLLIKEYCKITHCLEKFCYEAETK